MPASDSTDRTPCVKTRFARLFAVLAIALTMIAIPASMPADASAKQMSEHVAMRRCLAAGGKVSWNFHIDGTADMQCTLPSQRGFTCVPWAGPFANMVYCL